MRFPGLLISTYLFKHLLALLISILKTEILIPEKVFHGNLLLQVWLLLYIAFVGFVEAATIALFWALSLRA